MSPLDRKVGKHAAVCPLAEQEGQLVRLGSCGSKAMQAAAELADMVDDAVALLCLGQRGVQGIRLGVAGDIDGGWPIHDFSYCDKRTGLDTPRRQQDMLLLLPKS